MNQYIKYVHVWWKSYSINAGYIYVIYSESYFEFSPGYWSGLVVAVDLLGIALK